jgi:hypothetical protein
LHVEVDCWYESSIRAWCIRTLIIAILRAVFADHLQIPFPSDGNTLTQSIESPLNHENMSSLSEGTVVSLPVHLRLPAQLVFEEESDVLSGDDFHFLNRTILSPIVSLKLRMSRQRSLANNSAFYAASTTLRDKLQWLEDRPVSHLVDKTKLILSTNLSHKKRVPSAVLSTIVYFTNVEFCFNTDDPSSRLTRSKTSFSDIVLIATAVPPAQIDLAKDFRACLSNLDRFITSARTTPTSTTRGVFSYYYWDRRLEFRHAPFIVCL